jgi:hypothetical protein
MADELFEFKLRIQGPEGQRTFESARVGLEAFAKDIAVATSARKINPIIQAVLKRHLKILAEAMTQRHSTRWAPGQKLPTGRKKGRLAVRSGEGIAKLRQSVRVWYNSKGTFGEIGGPFYFVTHEEGRTIHAKRGYMAIPLEDALDSRGVPLRPSARSWQDTFLIRLKGQPGFIIAQRRGARVRYLYLLKKTVVIPERLGLGETILKGTPALIDKVLNAITISVATKAVTGRDVNPRGFG